MAKKLLICEVLTTIKGLLADKPDEYTFPGTVDTPTLLDLEDTAATRELIDARAIRIWPGPKMVPTPDSVKINQLQEEINQLQEENNQLQVTVKDMEKQLKPLAKKNEELGKKIEALQESKETDSTTVSKMSSALRDILTLTDLEAVKSTATEALK